MIATDTAPPNGQEALMGKAIPTQHPAVVLRAHFNQLRALLAVALIGVIGLTVAVVILAGNEDQISDSSSATPVGHVNYGGFNPATGRRYDGGPDEGTRGPVKDYGANSATADVPAQGTRYDGGPEEGSRGSGR